MAFDKRVLVFGASGTAGSGAVRALLRQGYGVTCVLRSERSVSALPAGVEVVYGDVTAPEMGLAGALSAEKFDVLVLELSSFQLHWMREASFVAAAILNIAQDHVDWHGGFEAYAQAKMSILDRSSTGIFNGDDAEVVARATHWQGRKVFFSLDTPGPGEIGVVEELLVDRAFVSDPKEAAMMLGVGLIGYVQVTARHWLERDSKLTRQQAMDLVENLMWRGISGFPRTDS